MKNDPRRLREAQQSAPQANEPEISADSDSPVNQVPSAEKELAGELQALTASDSKVQPEKAEKASVETTTEKTHVGLVRDAEEVTAVEDKSPPHPQMTEMAKAVAAYHNLDKPAFAAMPSAFEKPAASETRTEAAESGASITANEAEQMLKQALNQSDEDASQENKQENKQETPQPLASRSEPAQAAGQDQTAAVKVSEAEVAAADAAAQRPPRRRSRAHNDPRAKRQTQQIELPAEPEGEALKEPQRTEESNL